MRIVDVTPIVCDAGWRPWIFVKVTTSSGVVGYGECSDNRSPHAVLGAIEDIKSLVVGRDPRHVEALYWDMYRATRHSYGGVVQKAIAGINCALWDVKARDLGVPVYELFGGPTRDDVRVYWTHLGSYRIQHGDWLGTPAITSLDSVVDVAREAVERGFTALKTNAIDVSATPPAVISQGFGGGGGTTDRNPSRGMIESLSTLMGSIRDGVGESVDLAIDLNFNFTPEGNRLVAAALEPFDLSWIEFDSLDPESLRRVKDTTSIPVCSGEALYTTAGYRPFFEARAMDIAMVDIPWNGFTAAKKIADMAEAFEVNICPHNYYSHLSTSTSAHLCASVPNVRIMECEIEDVPWKDDIVTNPPEISGGHLKVPAGPGWGTELVEGEIAKHPWSG